MASSTYVTWHGWRYNVFWLYTIHTILDTGPLNPPELPNIVYFHKFTYIAPGYVLPLELIADIPWYLNYNFPLWLILNGYDLVNVT